MTPGVAGQRKGNDPLHHSLIRVGDGNPCESARLGADVLKTRYDLLGLALSC